MSWLQFIENMTSSLAWPVSIVVIVILLRKQLLALLQRIAEVTLPGGYKIVFHEALEEVHSFTEGIEAKPPSTATAHIRDHGLFYSKFEGTDIVSQMLSAYAAVEEHLTELAAAHSLTGTHWAIWRSLERKGVLSANAANALENLRKARNALVHIPQQQVTTLEAIEFVGQAETLRRYLQSLIEKAPHKRN